MSNSVRPTDCEEVLTAYGNMLFRLCLVTCGNPADAEDALQETLLKYLQRAPEFLTEEHRKAWLIRVATNCCRDLLRHRTRHPSVVWEDLSSTPLQEEENRLLDILLTLPEKFRGVLVLHYLEGYGTAEIAKMIGKTPSAVKMRLKKGRELLRNAYERSE